MNASLTTSELQFEHWCRLNGVDFRRIREARVQGHKRPDYAISILHRRCIVEVKQIDPTLIDTARYNDARSGISRFSWVDPGARLRQAIKDADPG